MSVSLEDKARTWLKSLFGESNDKKVRLLQDYVKRANQLESQMEKLSDEQLAGKTAEFRNQIDNALKGVENKILIPDTVTKMPGQIRTAHDRELGKVLEHLLPESFAVCREASRRVLGMRHFDVQLMGGAALHFNKIAEMRTGEGKTLVATLPVYLNGLTGRGVHVVTVNDYLARRDSEWMGRLYKFLGLTTGLVYSHQGDDEKMSAYRADITYGTNHEFGFDYLRDNMRTSLDQLAQRNYYYAIVDEVDNILIDEARTPLIISGYPTESLVEVYTRMAQVSPMLHRGRDKDDEDCDYFVDEKGKNVLLTERGILNAERLCGVSDLYDVRWNLAHHLSQALRAKELYKVDTDYVIRMNDEGKPEIVIVDEFTGRMMIGRRWSDGLHQAIEAKEGVPIQDETMTYASITYQNLFRLYPKLAGMTGTAMTEAAEFSKIYNLDVVSIPTNRESIRGDNADVIYKTEPIKFFSVVEEIVDLHRQGRPVLVGTTSIEKSELVADLLSKPQGMNEFLNRKITKCIDVIRAKKLTGPAIDGLKKIFERPGLIDPEKMERAAEQVASEFSKQEELIDRVFSVSRTANTIAEIRKGVPHHVLNAKHHEKEAMIIAQAGRKGAITIATNMAGRGTDILLGGNPEYLAKDKLKKDGVTGYEPDYDDVVKQLTKKYKDETDKEHDEVVALGGLHIIGTERHESRRIDNQLRGRAGRQGDPGSSRFYLSLEDTLMRIFGGDKIAKLMDFIRADDEMPIESPMVSKSIEGAQKKVEAYHFDMRKHVLQYDDVLNTQREVIYRERRRILERGELREAIVDMLDEHVDIVLKEHIDSEEPPETWEEAGLPGVLTVLTNDIPLLSDITLEELSGLSYDDLQTKLREAAKMAYEVRESHVGEENMRELERQVLLRTIDTKWVDYLHNIEVLREGIHLRGYGQRDPLQEYKKEAFGMFEALLRSIQQESVQLLFRAQMVSMDSDMEMDEIMSMLEEFQQIDPDADDEEAEGLQPMDDDLGPGISISEAVGAKNLADHLIDDESVSAEDAAASAASASADEPEQGEVDYEFGVNGDAKSATAGNGSDGHGAAASAAADEVVSETKPPEKS